MAPPRPDRLHLRIAELRSLLADLSDNYRWAYDLAFSPGSRSLPEPGGTRNPAQTRPTENMAVADVPARAACERTADRVEGMIRDVRGLINTMLPRADRTSDRPDAYPRTITIEERRLLEQAQQRRTDRGDGWGSG